MVVHSVILALDYIMFVRKYILIQQHLIETKSRFNFFSPFHQADDASKLRIKDPNLRKFYFWFKALSLTLSAPVSLPR